MSTSTRNLARAALAALLALLLAACGLTAPRSSDGYADLDSLGLTDTDLVMSLSLGPAVLGFAARHVEDDPETEALLRDLDGVRIRIYEVDRNPDRVAGRMARMARDLQADGWEPVMLVQREGEQVHMLLRVVDGAIHGMTVLVLDGESEAVVINLMGDIHPDRFGDVMVAMDIDHPGVEQVRVADSADG